MLVADWRCFNEKMETKEKKNKKKTPHTLGVISCPVFITTTTTTIIILIIIIITVIITIIIILVNSLHVHIFHRWKKEKTEEEYKNNSKVCFLSSCELKKKTSHVQFHADIFSFLLFLQKTKKMSSSLETFLFYLFIFFSPHQTRAGSGWHVTSPLLCVGVFSTCLFRFLRAPRARLAFFFFFHILAQRSLLGFHTWDSDSMKTRWGDTKAPRALKPSPSLPVRVSDRVFTHCLAAFIWPAGLHVGRKVWHLLSLLEDQIQ